MQQLRFTSLAIAALLFVGACGDQSITGVPSLRPIGSARLDAISTSTNTQFCSGGTDNAASNLAVSGMGAAANGVVIPQANVPWTGTGTNVGSASAKWVVPAAGANIDFYDNQEYTYTTAEFTIPAGYTADLSGLTLRDNSTTSVTLTNTGTNATTPLGGEAHNNAKANFGAGGAGDAPSPLAFSTTGVAAGTYKVSFVVWNENLLNDVANHGIAYPGAGRGAPNPTGMIFCFTVTPHQVPVQPVALFVIGDVEAHAIGDNVNFWGAQWWKNNQMSGLVSNGVAAFKGYATESTNACGGTWVSKPGNSSNPPNTIPSKIVIIVTSKVIKNGNDISGNIVQLLNVDVDPGYAGNPGHWGTGNVTSVVCPSAR